MPIDLDKWRKRKAARNEAEKLFGEPAQRQAIADQYMPELWDKCAQSWPTADDANPRVIFGLLLERLIALAEHQIDEIAIFDELIWAIDDIRQGRQWSELFPDGMVLHYDGNNADAFVAELKANLNFDPSADENWSEAFPDGSFVRVFVCPAHLLNAILGYPVSSF